MQKPNDLTPEQFAKMGVGDKLRSIKEHFDDCIIMAPLTTDRERMREMLREKLGTEKILWYGQPDAEITAKRSSRNFWWVTTLLLAAIALLALPAQPSFMVGKLVLGGLALLTFYWGFKAPKFERRMAQQTLYAVTENQVVEMKCAEDKPAGTVVKWFLFQHERGNLVEPVKKKVKNSTQAYDVLHSVLQTEDSRSEHQFKAVTDADSAVAALEKLRRGKSTS